MDVLGCLPADVSTTSTRLVRNEATVYGLVLDCSGDWRVAHSGRDTGWLIAGNINCQTHLQL